MPGTRAVAQIRADLAAAETEFAEQGRRETAERASACGTRCEEAIRKGEAAKASRETLRAELAGALDGTKADADLTNARSALDAVKAPAAIDPQAATLAAYVPAKGFTEREAAMLLPLLPTLIVEIGAPVCFLMAGAFLGFARQRRRSASTALASVDRAATKALPPAVSPQKRLLGPQASAPLAKPKASRAMSAAELSAVRAALGESQEAFAGRFSVNVRDPALEEWRARNQPQGRPDSKDDSGRPAQTGIARRRVKPEITH